MSRLAVSVLVLAACADVGPFRSTDGESIDAGLSDVDAATTMSDGPAAAVPVKLATSTKSPSQIVLTSANVYFTELDSQGIVIFPRNGDTPRIGDAGGVPLVLAAGGSTIYWIADHTVKSYSESASQPVTRLTSPTLVNAIGVSATDAFTIDAGPPPNGPGSISRLANAGGAATTVLDGLTSPRAVAASGSTLVWAAGSAVKRAPLASLGSAQTIGTNQTTVFQIVFDGTRACWTNATEFEIYDVWCAGPGAAQRIATAQVQVYGFALTSTHLYYTHRPTATANQYVIESYELATGTKRTLRAVSDRYPSSLAADDDALYWIESYPSSSTGEIWRLSLR
ncbi:MAG: hypothetical protein HOV81_26085 [Kofleriaceae bacterium]|nr:hypothetical protein [Kofleriaceae bacterium]